MKIFSIQKEFNVTSGKDQEKLPKKGKKLKKQTTKPFQLNLNISVANALVSSTCVK